jgi:hypothetical protein
MKITRFDICHGGGRGKKWDGGFLEEADVFGGFGGVAIGAGWVWAVWFEKGEFRTPTFVTDWPLNEWVSYDSLPTQSQTPTHLFAWLATKVGILRFAVFA